jgi:hypothetical protein
VTVPAEEDGRSTVIRARVRARLLGVQLLTVDARIDVGPPGSRADALDAPSTRRVTARRRPAELSRPRGGLRRAELLLEEAARPS